MDREAKQAFSTMNSDDRIAQLAALPHPLRKQLETLFLQNEMLLSQNETLSSQNETLSSQNETLLAKNEELLSHNKSLQISNDIIARDSDAISRERDAFAQNLIDAKKRIDGLMGEYNKLVEMIKIMNARAFGAHSEKVLPYQVSLFNDIEAAAPAAEDEASSAPKKSRKKRKPIDWSKFETVVIEHELPENERVCSTCGSPLDEMTVEVRRIIRVVPAHFTVEEHRRHVYICTPCSAKNATDGVTPVQIKRAEMPAFPLGKSFASAALLAEVIHRKYALAQPLYRIAEDFKTDNLAITRQTMAEWVIGVHERWLAMLYDLMAAELLTHSIIHCDETTVQVLKEPKRKASSKSYMWLFAAAECDTPVFIFRYAPTRAGDVVRTFLSGWKGTVVTDGYKPYETIGEGISRTSCLVHIRRKFADVVKGLGGNPETDMSGALSVQAIRMIDEIFATDHNFKDLTYDERKLARQKDLAPKMEAFRTWCLLQRDKCVPRMALHQAFDYALGQWDALMHVLDDGRLPLSNNVAERAIRPFSIGRKNWLFSDTPRGADASAAIYSIITTAKANGLRGRDYIEWLLEEMPNTAGLEDASVLARFLPWSKDVPESCRIAKDAPVEEDPLDIPIVDLDPHALDSDY